MGNLVTWEEREGGEGNILYLLTTPLATVLLTALFPGLHHSLPSSLAANLGVAWERIVLPTGSLLQG